MAEEKFYCLFDKLIKLTIINKMITKIYSNIQIPYTRYISIFISFNKNHLF